MNPWIAEHPVHLSWLDEHTRHLLRFGRRTVAPGLGAAYLGVDGTPDPSHGTNTWITCRMVHVYAIGALLGVPGCRPVAQGVLDALRDGPLRDASHGGWYRGLSPEGTPEVEAGKAVYDHAFVLLAASSAVLAGLEGGADLLEDATEVFLERFWDDDAGRVVDHWDASFTTLDDYRGLNGTMHSVEAMLAVADAAEDDAQAMVWRRRASRMCELTVELSTQHNGRLPEHFDAQWVADLEMGAPDDQFLPFGATPGHGFEWARLLTQLEVADPDLAPAGSLDAARRLFATAVADGWRTSGHDGFVYTTDFSGAPVVSDRMHWVAAEAIGAADALHRRTGDASYRDHYLAWWDHVDTSLIDHERGSWHHQLDPANVPTTGVWPGKPDLYHAFQATLLPRVPLGCSLTRAVRDRQVAA
ncbi:MAG: AGE family epimerase/isomerase [Propionibacteriaceae bacterium]|jgi:mannose/cellobiose epimerase-like protein (N-acyl-D-glucosamine 2-epimerase family)|nr:AGE family epimerase/isomerase [Propionibacteriaceae bacterium]